jgi:hypothetical protein
VRLASLAHALGVPAPQRVPCRRLGVEDDIQPRHALGFAVLVPHDREFLRRRVVRNDLPRSNGLAGKRSIAARGFDGWMGA